MKRWFTWRRAATYGVVLLLLAAWFVPKISAERFREPIRAALENALGRKVKVGSVEFRLLPVPGFTIGDVRIGEDPAIGAEPVAYVKKLRARPRISALFGGPLAFASVDLEETSVNLTRVESEQGGVRWNFASLMRPTVLATFPSIHVISGRVNFKFADTKSIFYLLNTDVDLWPPAEAEGAWTLRVHAEPARTDRPARGFGSFVARGQWHPREGTVTLDVKLQKSELGDMVTLVQGHESGMHGHVSGDAHLAGPLSRLGIAGRVNIDDIHGWNQTPTPGGGQSWPLSVSGAINLPGQVVDLRASTGGKAPPLDIRYSVSNYLARPDWKIGVILTRMPVAPLAAIARSVGWNLPADWKFDGAADGMAGYTVRGGVPVTDGQMTIVNAAISPPNAAPLRVADAHLQFAGSTVTLAPVAITNAAHETATAEGSYDLVSQSFVVGLASDGMAMNSLARQVPVLGLATAGEWSGDLRYSSEWSGVFQLRDADIPFEAFAEPLRVISADVTVDGSRVAMKNASLSIAGMQMQGDYAYDPSQVRHHHFRISVAKAAADKLEKLLMPALHRGTFLSYAFNFGRVPEPGWMVAMSADGSLQVGTLELGGKTFTKLRARVLWDGDQVRLSALQAQLVEAAVSGEAQIDLSQREPRYQVNGKIAGLPWRSGVMEAEGTLRTAGTGTELLSAMNAQGAFKARNPVEKWDSVNGCFDWNHNGIKLRQLVMTSAGETWLGDGEATASGKLTLHVSDGRKTMQDTLDLGGQ